MLKIGEFSKLSRVSVRMLRHYDEIGLLKPERIDGDTGYRYYSQAQLLTAARSAQWKELGFSLATLRQLRQHYDDKQTLERLLLARRDELLALEAQTQQRLRRLDTALERLRKENTMHYDVNQKTFPVRYAATVRGVIPGYEHEGLLWNTLMGETAELHLIADDPCYCCAVFHDKEYQEGEVDVEVQQTVKGNYCDTEHVKFRTLPSVTVASAMCRGSYAQMGEINAAVAQWIEDNGWDYDGPMFNIYHVGPGQTQNPEEFVTEVCYPIKKK